MVLATSIETLWNSGGQPYSQVRRFQCHGYLSADGQAALTVAENALKVALQRNFQDLVFKNDDSSVSSEVLLNAPSISGVRITGGPNFAMTDSGAEYATIRTFDFTAEAEYPLPLSQLLLLSFTETLSFSGGGPLYAHRPAINGPPQKQLIYPLTPFVVTQSGEAVGYRAYPIPPGPLFPGALKKSGDFRRRAPDRKGVNYQGWTVTWNYEFESASALSGVPNLWRG